MHAPLLARSRRTRRTPFTDRVTAAGVKAYTVYNHMLLPAVFRSVEEDYHHLKSAVQLWDVACERQIELSGPDAERLLQMTSPRDLSRMATDQCYYVPIVDVNGGMINDPIVLKLASDRFWVSIADSDLMYYYKGLAGGFGMDVQVSEPDISPLAIQGPKADILVERLFGKDIRETKFFRHKTITFQGQDMVIARSGWSRQIGFEIYMDGTRHGPALWDHIMEAGEDLDIRAGCPNGIERIEAGLLSYGNDVTLENTPFEADMGKYVQLDRVPTCRARAALLEKQVPDRQLRAVEMSGDPLPACTEPWPLLAGGTHAGIPGQLATDEAAAGWRVQAQSRDVEQGHGTPGTGFRQCSRGALMDVDIATPRGLPQDADGIEDPIQAAQGRQLKNLVPAFVRQQALHWQRLGQTGGGSSSGHDDLGAGPLQGSHTMSTNEAATTEHQVATPQQWGVTGRRWISSKRHAPMMAAL